MQHRAGLRVSWAGAAAGCHPLQDVTLSVMPPSLGCHPLRDATLCRLPPAAGRCRAPPSCPSAAAKLQPSREGSGCSCAQVLLQIFHSCACCTATGRRRLLPAALFLASAAPRPRCRGLLGLLGPPQGGRGPRLGPTSCLWPEGVGGKPSGSLGCGAGGVWGAEGGDAPKVIEWQRDITRAAQGQHDPIKPSKLPVPTRCTLLTSSEAQERG